MKYVNTATIVIGLLALSFVAAINYATVSLKEQCLRSGGTSVEIAGHYERCIEH